MKKYPSTIVMKTKNNFTYYSMCTSVIKSDTKQKKNAKDCNASTITISF